MIDPLLLGRLQNGNATEDDVRIFLNKASQSDSYNNMNYPAPEEFIKKVKSNADKSIYNSAKSIEVNGLPDGVDYNSVNPLMQEKENQHTTIDNILRETDIPAVNRSK